jgi:signal transduction histidine kinase/DNA-binding LacI/PurR family transcriptional regulator
MLTQDLLELFAEQWLGSVDAASAHGCDFICFCGRALGAPGFQAQSNALYDLVTGEALDGLVVWTSILGFYLGHDRVEEFCRRFDPLPIVSVEEPLGQAPVVLMENRQGMYAAVSHLIEAHGRRRIAFIRGPDNHAGAQERYQGYLDALAHHGLAVHPELVSNPPPAWIPEAAAAEITRMLRQGARLDGVAAANDDHAVAALSALSAAGVRTPEDVAVVGFDDFTNIRTHDMGFDSESGDDTGAVRRAVNLSASALALTTVRAPFREMGRRSVELLLAMLRGETVPDFVRVPTQLIVRRSCGCLPTAPRNVSAPSAQPDPPTTQLRRVLTEGSAELPTDWPERLSDAFVDEMRGRSSGAFLGLLDRFMQVSLRAGEDVESWWRVLFALRQLIGYPSAGVAEVMRAEDMLLHAQMLLNETAERRSRYIQVLTEKRNQIVREVGQHLITASDVAGLADTLAEELPKIGIPCCYLASYESAAPAGNEAAVANEAAAVPGREVSKARSRLLLAYEHGWRTELAPGFEAFESVQLVPGDRLHRASPYSVVAVPLYFKEQQLGFALFELGPRIGWIYAALQDELSTALHRAFLVERERAAVAAVTEAHRREERHRLAGELHDSVSQALFSMTLHTRAVQLAAQQQGWDSHSRIIRGLAELRELTQGALTEMRALIFQLRPDALHEEGLVVAIRRHAAAVAAREGFEVHVHAPEDRLPLGDRAEEELFRVVQEALHNSVKHAHPSQVDIRLEEPADAVGTLVVEICDDGVGFDPDVPRSGHLGLDSMYERTQRLGGRFTVDSSPAGSTTVRAVLPDILGRRATSAPMTGTTPT